jgi:hypothetical protein
MWRASAKLLQWGVAMVFKRVLPLFLDLGIGKGGHLQLPCSIAIWSSQKMGGA